MKLGIFRRRRAVTAKKCKKKRVVVILIYQLDEFYSCTCFTFRTKLSTFFILSENNLFISKAYLISTQHDHTQGRYASVRFFSFLFFFLNIKLTVTQLLVLSFGSCRLVGSSYGFP